MVPAPSGGWRFILPESAAGSAGPGLQVSLTGGIEMVTGAAAVRQSINLLLHTRPGERVMRPEYGCDIHRLVFAPNDDTTAGLAIHYIRRALQRWEPRVDVLRLDAYRDPDLAECLRIDLTYRVRSTRQSDSLVLSIDLQGGGA